MPIDGSRALFAGEWGDSAVVWGIVGSILVAIVLTLWSALRFQRLSG